MRKGTGLLKGKRVGILGFGSQGRAQALNLRDSGITPLVGLPSRGKSRVEATRAGFEIYSAIEVIEKSDIIAVLMPDHKHKDFFDSLDQKALSKKGLIFAHGLSVAFGLTRYPSDCDIIMVAPHGPGVRLRERYVAGETFTAFVAVEQNYSSKAWDLARAYAAAIGCPSKNLFKSTFEDEAVGDIFGEQGVLCGGLVGLLEAGFETLVKNGHSRESAYLECVYQLDLIIDLIKRHGPAGMFKRISKTAAYGSLETKDMLFDDRFTFKMERLYDRIKKGTFARELIRQNDNDLADLKSMLSESARSSLQKTHELIAKKLNDRKGR